MDVPSKKFVCAPFDNIFKLTALPLEKTATLGHVSSRPPGRCIHCPITTDSLLCGIVHVVNHNLVDVIMLPARIVIIHSPLRISQIVVQLEIFLSMTQLLVEILSAMIGSNWGSFGHQRGWIVCGHPSSYLWRVGTPDQCTSSVIDVGFHSWLIPEPDLLIFVYTSIFFILLLFLHIVRNPAPSPSTLINVIILPVVVALCGLLLCPLFVFDEKDGNGNDDHVPSIIIVVKNVVSRHSKFTAKPSADTKGGVRQPS